MAECELCNEKDAEIERFRERATKQRLLIGGLQIENAKLRDGISQSIADGCGGLSPPCDACIVLQKLLAETETAKPVCVWDGCTLPAISGSIFCEKCTDAIAFIYEPNMHRLDL